MCKIKTSSVFFEYANVHCCAQISKLAIREAVPRSRSGSTERTSEPPEVFPCKANKKLTTIIIVIVVVEVVVVAWQMTFYCNSIA